MEEQNATVCDMVQLQNLFISENESVVTIQLSNDLFQNLLFPGSSLVRVLGEGVIQGKLVVNVTQPLTLFSDNDKRKRVNQFSLCLFSFNSSCGNFSSVVLITANNSCVGNFQFFQNQYGVALLLEPDFSPWCRTPRMEGYGLSRGQVIAIAIGSAAFAIIVVTLLILFARRFKSKDLMMRFSDENMVTVPID